MKIKQDFITNSSSTGHVVSIPKDFNANQEDILKYFESHEHDIDIDDDENKWEKTRIIAEFEECIELLKSGDNIWCYGDEGCDLRIYSTILDICSYNDFILISYDSSGDGNNRIDGIKEEVMTNWFMNNQLKKLEIEVKDE
jgi:hypothetical protein